MLTNETWNTPLFFIIYQVPSCIHGYGKTEHTSMGVRLLLILEDLRVLSSAHRKLFNYQVENIDT